MINKTILKKAVKFSKLSALVYKSEEEQKRYFESKGLNHKFFDKDGTQAMAYVSPSEIGIIFRGTEPNKPKDVFADLDIRRKVCTAYPQALVHSGFQESIDDIYSDLKTWIDQEQDKKQKIYVSGHSLGAALATIAATRFDCEEVYTFGSPRVGNKKFKISFNQTTTKHYRFVNNNDIVTTVPLPFRFKHCGEEIYINSLGIPTNAKYLKHFVKFKDKFKGRLKTYSKFKLFDGFSDHNIQEYYKNLKKHID